MNPVYRYDLTIFPYSIIFIKYRFGIIREASYNTAAINANLFVIREESGNKPL
jgi:hypothetical protein